jgi:HEAT repeat protein
MKTRKYLSAAKNAQITKEISALLCALCVLCGHSIIAQNAGEDREIAVLQSSATLQEKDAACLSLRTIAAAKSVTALAALLPDENLSHSARLVLEGMSAAEAGRALVDAIEKTTGLTRIGIVNSIAVRAEKSAIPSLAKLLADSDSATVSAAADALGQIGGGDAIKALENAPSSAHAATINALLACANRLLDSGDKSGAFEIFKQFDNPKEEDFVRTAAFRGIVRASAGNSLPLVVEAIKGTDRAKQIAALQLIHELELPGHTKAFGNLLPEVSPAIQVSLIEVLSERGETSALAALEPLISSADSSVRSAAIMALGKAGGASLAVKLARTALQFGDETRRYARRAMQDLHGDIAAVLAVEVQKAAPDLAVELIEGAGRRTDDASIKWIVDVLATTTDETVFRAAREVILFNFATAKASHREIEIEPLLLLARNGSPSASSSALEILALSGDARARDELRRALKDDDPRRREKAARALCVTSDGELLPDIIAIACDGEIRHQSQLAFVAATSLIESSQSLTRDEKVSALKKLSGVANQPMMKTLLLSTLGVVPCEETLAIAKGMLNSADVAAEANEAVAQIEGAMSARKLKDGFILDWQVAGPFRENGKDYRALFDTVFPPEIPDARNVSWRALPTRTDAAKPWLLDLLKALGNEHQCVAYVRTRIHSDARQPVRLEIGSDDGARVWLNGAQVHANNTARAIVPGSDRVNVTLNAGWNSLVMKITQNIMGWEFCVRVAKPDGSQISGLGVDATGAP